MVKRRAKTTKCLSCDAPKITSHGLCQPCYIAALGLVKNGTTTWNELESLGLATTVHSQNLLTGSAIFLKAYIDAKICKAIEE